MMPELRANHLLIAAATLFAALSIGPWLPSAANPAPAEPEIAAPPSLSEIPPLSHFAAISERPLFQPSRQPPAAERPAPAAPLGIEARYRVVGLIIAGPSRRALLMSADRKLEVGEGDNLDGWRVDVANMTGRLAAEDLAHQVARTVRRTVEETRPDGWLLAEHAHDASLDLDGTGWHGTMDYSGFTRPAWCWLSGPSGVDFMGLPVDVPRLPAEAVVATMRDVHAAMPWQSFTGSTMHLDSHDVARFRTVVGGGTDGWVDHDGLGRDRHLVGVALQMTMPGVPVVFAGDEIGLTGVDGEQARTPFPWGRRDEWDEATLEAYRTWIAVRREHVALRRGGLRWLGADGDSMTYLREHPEQTVLVHLTRAPTSPTRVPLGALGPDVRGVTSLVGEWPVVEGDHLVLPGAGPAALAVVVS